MNTRVFDGSIAGLGTTSGLRLVVGSWTTSSLGPFADVMIETAAGHRILLAPTERVAAFVAGTYVFDEMRIEPVEVTAGPVWQVRTPSLDVTFAVGRPHPVSRALRLVPGVVRDRETWARLCNPFARVLMPGVRTHGSAGTDRVEWYAARRVQHIDSLAGTFEDQPLGDLAPLRPAVRFGFSSAPATPSLTRVRSFVREARDGS
ncbi:hypothetical protein [Nocardioides sp. InS609-2]|uniref:hypothetical protein n=1 Tax=Nocardioides sp. InS609-2 TaxID=2760705 RepID=UPI0020BE5C97|nr:hypothetical protein [Nocardioides sp. InS609-2]